MSENRKKNKEVKIRLQDDLHAQLKKMAEYYNRPITRQVEWYIQQGLLNERGGVKIREISEKNSPMSAIDKED